MDFASAIKKLRKNCLMSQSDFAEALGVAFSTVNRWENGKSMPNFKAMKVIDEFCQKQNLDFDIRKLASEEKK